MKKLIKTQPVLELLAITRVPTYTSNLCELGKITQVLEAKPVQLIRLCEREKKRFILAKDSSGVYLTPSLSTNAFEPIPRILTDSRWGLEFRLIGPYTTRVVFLEMLINTIIYLELEGRFLGQASLEKLERFVRNASRSVSGAVSWREPVDLNRIREAIENELKVLYPLDSKIRQTAAKQLSQLPLHTQFWGQEWLQKEVADGYQAIERIA